MSQTRFVLPGERGLDFAYSKPPPAVVVRLGYTFVVGYVSTNPSKDLLNPKDYLNAGLAVNFVYETYATRPSTGAQGGYLDGSDCKFKLIQRGYPTEVAVIVAFDTNTVSANAATHKAYYDAFAQNVAPYRIGAYEDTDLAKVTNAEETIDWLPLAWSWSGTSKADARAKAISLGYHVFQEQGYIIDGLYAVDPNTVVKPFLAWSYVGNPVPPSGDDDMKITNAETRLHTDGNTYPPGVIKWAYGTPGKRHIKNEEESLTLYPAGPGIALSNAALDAIPDVGAVSVVVPPVTIPLQKTHFKGALLAQGVVEGDLT